MRSNDLHVKLTLLRKLQKHEFDFYMKFVDFKRKRINEHLRFLSLPYPNDELNFRLTAVIRQTCRFCSNPDKLKVLAVHHHKNLTGVAKDNFQFISKVQHRHNIEKPLKNINMNFFMQNCNQMIVPMS